ncbi:hypothetical protein GCM10023319_12870 [Nocardia iowensis]
MSTDTDPAPRTSRNPAFAERLAGRRLSAAVVDLLVMLPLSLGLAVAAVATWLAPTVPMWAPDRTTGPWRRTGVRADPILAGIAAYHRGHVHRVRAQLAGHRRVAGIATSDDEGRRVAAQPV